MWRVYEAIVNGSLVNINLWELLFWTQQFTCDDYAVELQAGFKYYGGAGTFTF